MTVDRLTLRDFTAFGEANFEFSPGLNVLIGANGTGKSHALKVLYSFLRPLAFPRPDAETGRRDMGEDAPLVLDKLFAVLRPEPTFRSEPGKGAHHSLTRHGVNNFHVGVRGDFGNVEFGNIELDVEAGTTPTAFWELKRRPSGPVIFVPSAEVLSVYPGFVSAYERRELSFDETFRDLCVDLSATPLRSVSPPALVEVAEKLDEAVGGKTLLRGNRFYVSLAENWLLEAPMLAEGLRKLATVAYLIRNGSLSEKSVLFWDEPETNMNPILITKLARTLLALAAAGIQVFVATHDYLLTNELSLAAEYQTVEGKAAKLKFFCLNRASSGAPVEVQSGATLNDLAANPILEEFVSHYNREQSLFNESASLPAGERSP
jgi:energy-coupling factor transporter ATP-binding protein EcfA2